MQMSEKETLYTRGGASGKDDRGVSMVERHRSKLQQAREEVAMRKLRPVVPEILSNAILLEALRQYDYNVDTTISSLRHFMEDEKSELKALHRKKEERKSRLLEERGISLRQEDSPSTSSGSGSIDSEDESRERRKRRHRKRSRHDKKKRDKRSSRRRRDHDYSSSESEPSDDDRHERKRERRKSRDRRTRHKYDDERRRRKKGKPSSRKDGGQDRYGRYGVIRETDLYAKRPEFMLWAMEVKNKDVENLSRFDEKELFKTFMDEYNLATLPHKKYYDLDKYEMSKKGRGHKTVTTERMVFDDESERRRETEEQRLKEKDERLRQAYSELKSSSKAQDMREQELLRAKMDLAYRTGDQKEAERIAERLRPDDL